MTMTWLPTRPYRLLGDLVFCSLVLLFAACRCSARGRPGPEVPRYRDTAILFLFILFIAFAKKIHTGLLLRKEMPGGAPRERKLRNVCTASDYEELREAYRFVPEAPASAGTTSAAHTQSADSTASTWQSRMARRYESHLYREFVLADLTRYQSGQVGLRWRTRDEVSCGKGFDTCGNKHCSSYGGSGTRDIEAARRASRSRMSEEFARRYYLNARKRPGEAIATKHSQRGSEDEEEEEMAALSQLSYGCGLADYEVPFSYVEQEEQRAELVKLRLCLRCAPMLFFGRGGALGAKMARERLSSAQTIASTKQQFKEDEEEDASSDSSRSGPHSTSKDKRQKRRKKTGRKRKKDKEHTSREQRRRKKCRHSRRKEKKEDSDSDSGADSSDDASINSVDSSIEGRRAEEGLLASVSLAECMQK